MLCAGAYTKINTELSDDDSPFLAVAVTFLWLPIGFFLLGSLVGDKIKAKNDEREDHQKFIEEAEEQVRMNDNLPAEEWAAEHN
ncbi:MAG: hypothetical protein UT24_C0030G0017 [Candidatus Woesebacteria bacterium GW2011_GWB1_39_12]|uniref:Uncharacterized protein n=1 Tax=Candidatus Woesebacteria bacterium GW2011_GWB1_39_12 TaxID=1618574 RepID=A0A0G0PLC4_9BACT|nr:MAG: hypothetical protein UT24_C0030G0017 [Candidatus Woesebacteria bacterium GW2011_GWB1_39_12]